MNVSRNVLWNFAGQGAPLLAAVFAIPLLARGLGTERYGVLALIWMVVAYFSLLDLGLGRALTKLLAEKLGARQEQEIPVLAWSALFLMLILGIIGGLLMGFLSPWLVHRVLKVPPALQPETLRAFYLLASSIPAVIGSAGVGGILAAQLRFDLINSVRIPMSIFSFIGPVLVLRFSQSLSTVTAVLVVSRYLSLAILLWLCLRVMPQLGRKVFFKPAVIGPLIRFGSWLTVTNLIGPVMSYLDRFLIGMLISVKEVAYYSTPYDVVTKLTLISDSLVAVLFPAFASSFVRDRKRTVLIFSRGVKYTYLCLFVITLITVTLAHEGLNIWMGSEFALNSTSVLQWIAVGVFINSLARIPYVLIQSIGRPDLTAKLHLIELPFYLSAAWWLITKYGIVGAAIAWTARAALDAIVLFSLAQWLLSSSKAVIEKLSFATLAALFTFYFGSLKLGIVIKVVFLSSALLFLFLVTWHFILTPEERSWKRYLGNVVRTSI